MRLLFGLGWFLLCLTTRNAVAGGPRFVTGNGTWVQPGLAENWNMTQLLYFTDPGSLGSAVTHSQADAMVAAAAAVWNVPTSSLSLAQGGSLAEHVSSSNTSFDGTNVVFPSDVMATNEGAIPVPVIYDADGSVTELVLGEGTSSPLECRQNAVTESVDDIQPDGHIHHALLILNGRCVDGSAEKTTQMQYQLARAFGRVLGLAWSQANDNVFTAASQVTGDQEAYWPLMHPLDVLCGPYTYQCMVHPFTLRPDDLNSLETLYPVYQSNVPSGKQASDTDAVYLWTNLTFPNGQGMDWVNFTAHRFHNGVAEDFDLASGVTGTGFEQALGTPVNSAQAANSGSGFGPSEGYVSFRVVPVDGMSTVYLSSEPINPLYWGEYALGPYVRSPITPSGSPETWTAYSALPYADVPEGAGISAGDAPSACNSASDGTESQPATLDASGWQPGLLCGWGHSSWWSATIPAGRTWTFEVTATNEAGAPVTGKAATVIGMWNASDAAGTAPTVASVPVPFNSMALGVTQAQMTAFATDTTLRFAVSDLYGAGRPDFTYTARLLCLSVVAPTSVGFSGGTVTVTGTGFRAGVVLYVNGIAAKTVSVESNVLVALVPSAKTMGAQVGSPVSLAVVDSQTGASSSVDQALTYTDAGDVIKLVSGPSVVEAGFAAGTPFTVEVLGSDDVTPVSGAPVQFQASGSNLSFPLCPAQTACTVVTDDKGMAQVVVAGVTPGTGILTATEQTQGQSGVPLPSIQTAVQVVLPTLSASFHQAPAYLAAGAGATWTLQLQALHDGASASQVPVTWTTDAALATVTADSSTGTAGSGQITVSINAIAPGVTLSVTGCAWGNVCATWTVNGVAPADWRISVGSGTQQSITQGASLAPVLLLVQDAAGHPLQGAPVALYQRALAWEGACTSPGPCAAAPVLRAEQSSFISNPDGSVQFTPLEVPAVAQVVQVAASSGEEGFTSFNLSVTPAMVTAAF